MSPFQRGFWIGFFAGWAIAVVGAMYAVTRSAMEVAVVSHVVPPATAGEGLSFTPPPGPYPDVYTLKECRCVKDCWPDDDTLAMHYPEYEYECRDIAIPAKFGEWEDKDK